MCFHPRVEYKSLLRAHNHTCPPQAQSHHIRTHTHTCANTHTHLVQQPQSPYGKHHLHLGQQLLLRVHACACTYVFMICIFFHLFAHVAKVKCARHFHCAVDSFFYVRNWPYPKFTPRGDCLLTHTHACTHARTHAHTHTHRLTLHRGSP